MFVCTNDQGLNYTFAKVQGASINDTLFDFENGHVLVSKCRNDEQFSRRKGILTCLQKYLNNEGIPSHEKVIDSIQPAVDGMIIRLSKSHQKMFWWL